MATSRVPCAPSAVGEAAHDNWCRTEMKIEEFSYTWTIDNFTFRPEKWHQLLKSSTFPEKDPNHELTWCMCLYPKGVNLLNENFLSLYLQLLSCKSEVRATFAFSLRNSKGKSVFAKDSKSVYKFEQGQRFGWSEFIRRDVFRHVPGLLPDNKLTIICSVSVYGDGINNSRQPSAMQLLRSESVKMYDLGALLENEMFSDVSLCANGRELRAHKAILAARSPVFTAMFEHAMQEQRNNRVDITDIDPDILSEMLRFIYTDRVANLEQIAGDLLAAADKYCIEGLKELCEQSLCKHLSVENVASTLILADLHSCKRLKAKAVNFITIHATDE